MSRPDQSWDSTLSLLTRARAGDEGAMNDLFARYLPGLQRWARGRLPIKFRDLADTSDVVQEALAQAQRHARDVHRMEITREQVLAMARPG